MLFNIDKGKVLLSEPFMLEGHFKRSVVLLCDYSRDEGSVGFVLNKQISTNVNEIIEDFPEFNVPVYYGGPVGKDNIFYIHNVGDLLEDSVEVMSGIFWGGNFEKLKFLISSGLVQPSNIKFFVGYSGWSPGQLEGELKTGSWVITDMHPNYVFKTRPGNLWKLAMKNKGSTYTVIAQMPDNQNLN